MQKKTAIAGLIIIGFLLLLASVIFFIEKSKEFRRLDPLELESMSKEDIVQTIYDHQAKTTPYYIFIPIFGFFGVVVGASVYFVLNQDLEKKDKTLKHNTNVVLKLLSAEERKVINKLLENNGKVHQSEITYMEGFTKVRAHRIVEILVKKGIVKKETLGKARLITLESDIYEVLKKN
ncbi:MAG: helix-turn-helix transcriptional regulator [Candidatus Nanoarchaeia archaeon]